MIKRGLLCYFLLIAFCANAQVNLVPNGSFEVLDSCPTGPSMLNYAKPWFSPSIGTPDVYNECAGPNQSWNSVPDNQSGYQYAYEGLGYAGILVCSPGDSSNREYLAVKLLHELTINRTYCFTMYCSLFDLEHESNSLHSEYSITSVGVYFSPDSIFNNNSQYLSYTPQIQNPANNPIIGYDDWIKVEGVYKATDKDHYIYIGNFFDNTNTVLDTILDGFYDDPWVYFYIDSVSLVECNTTGISETPSSPLTIYPNPATNNVTITLPNDVKNAQLLVYDITGKQIQQTQLTSLKQIDISSLSNGLYLFVVSFDKGVLATEKIMVEN